MILPKNSWSLLLSIDCTSRLVKASTSASLPDLSGFVRGWFVGAGARPFAAGEAYEAPKAWPPTGS